MTAHHQKEVDMASPYDQQVARMQRRLASGKFSLEGTPGYRAGEKADLSQTFDYVDLYPTIWGRECGSAGIGKLREVAITNITEHESAAVYSEDPKFFHAFGNYPSLDIAKMQDQTDSYESALEEAGVEVTRIDFPDPPVSAFGPMMYMYAARELLILRGGSIVPKMGWNPFSIGRAEFLAKWALEELSVPILLTITGDVVCEPGPCLFLAEDVFVAAHSIAFTEGGLDQLYSLVRRTQRNDDMTFLTLRGGGAHLYFDPQSGGSAHPDMLIGPLDVDKVLLYPGAIDFETWNWLKNRDYEIVEVEHDEQVQFAPANIITLEPGRVIMHQEAKKAVAAVRAAGVDVVEVPFSEYFNAGGGLHCATMEVLRDVGPFSTDR